MMSTYHISLQTKEVGRLDKSEFYKIIEDNKVKGVFIGFWTLYFEDTKLNLTFMGDFDNPRYETYNYQTEEEKTFDSLEDVIEKCIIEGKPLKEQIAKLKSMSDSEAR